MPVMLIHTGASAESPVGALPCTHIKAITQRLASRQTAVFGYIQYEYYIQ